MNRGKVVGEKSSLFVLLCSHHASCSVIYRAIVTRGDVARVSTNLVLEIGRQGPALRSETEKRSDKYRLVADFRTTRQVLARVYLG